MLVFHVLYIITTLGFTYLGLFYCLEFFHMLYPFI